MNRKSDQIQAIWRLMEGQRGRYALAIGALVLASCLLYLAPLVTQVVLDDVLSDQSAEPTGIARFILTALGGADNLGERLWLAAALIAGLAGVSGVFTYLRGRWSADAAETIARNVRESVYDRLQHLPCTWHDQNETGDLIQRSTSDVETLRVFLATQVVEIGRALIMLIVPLPLMISIDWRMTVLSVILLPPIVFFSVLYFRRIRKDYTKVEEAEAEMTSTVQENLTGIRVVRAFARQDFERDRFEHRNARHRDADYHIYRLVAKFWALSDLMCFSQKAVVLGGGVFWLARGELTVGAFYFFLTAVGMFIWPVRQMGRILTDLGKAMVAIGRIRAILESEPEGASESDLQAHPIVGDLVFDQVSFSHGEESPVLKEVSFTLPAGQTLAILGPSGCGKSTIVNLLLRLYDYDDGSITFGGAELSRIDRKSVREQTASVMQEPFLYSRSLKENIRLGRSDAHEDEVIDAATIACVHESILEFDRGYDTVIGERGVTLSGGQRQRVALSRALIQKPALLILDDALSAVDTETESLILTALRERHGNQTTIVIAHRLSTLMHADQILVLEHGRVAQVGHHRDLVKQDGLYQRLWQIQSAEHAGSKRRERKAEHV